MYSIGLDISKSTINVYIPIHDLDIVISNDLKSIKSLYSKLKKQYKKEIDKLIFVYEPTGSYSSLLTKFCNQKGIKCFIVNPKKSANFSKVIGQRNKTDMNDARMLSQMCVTAKQDEIKVPIIDERIEEIKELITYYKFLSKQKTQNKNHLESIGIKKGSSIVIKKIAQEIKRLEQKEQQLLVEIKKILKKSYLNEVFINMQTIPGIAEVSAIVLLQHFIHYPNANQKQIISLAGLDPTIKESGSSIRGRTKISKSGSKLCRGVLFMSALVSIRYNERLKQFYERLKENGKHSTVAQIAVMRKLMIIAHSLYKNNEPYDVNRLKL